MKCPLFIFKDTVYAYLFVLLSVGTFLYTAGNQAIVYASAQIEIVELQELRSELRELRLSQGGASLQLSQNENILRNNQDTIDGNRSLLNANAMALRDLEEQMRINEQLILNINNRIDTVNEKINSRSTVDIGMTGTLSILSLWILKNVRTKENDNH